MENRPNKRKVLRGIVVSDKMNKSVVVNVQRRLHHARYGKVIKVYKKYYAHDLMKSKVGDRVKIVSTRPLSKLKKWRVTEVIK